MNIDGIWKCSLLFILLAENRIHAHIINLNYYIWHAWLLLKIETNTEAQSWTLDGSTRQIHHGVFVPGSMLELARPSSQPKHNKIDKTKMIINA